MQFIVDSENPLAVNPAHALSLVDSVEVNGQSLVYIHIYADAPDYRPVIATGEGVTCVDDAGRFLEVLESAVLNDNRRDLLPIVKGLTRFLLALSLPDGRWYNFMFANGEINRDHANSRPEFSWWAVRGLRGLAAAYTIFDQLGIEPELRLKIKERVHAADGQIAKVLSLYGRYDETTPKQLPLWLLNNAPDQTGELILALANLHQTRAFDYTSEIRQLGEAVTASQFHQQGHELNGMYFCWENTWHGWGNNQALALTKAYEITGDPAFLNSVTDWAQNFIPYWIRHHFPAKIEIENDLSIKTEIYPQIAYGIDSAYRGLREFNRTAGNETTRQNAEQILAWFTGENMGGEPMYDPTTGRCFDGINGLGSVNRNSGTESTIECLLALQAHQADQRMK